MDQALVGIVVLCGISVGTALLFHLKLRRFWVASILAAVTASVTFQFIGYLVLGYLDPFFMIALVTGGILALIIAAVVGWCLHHFRGRGPHPNTKP